MTTRAIARTSAFSSMAAPLVAVVGKLPASLLAWRRRARDRRSLQTLDDRLLRDIGLTRSDVTRGPEQSRVAEFRRTLS